MNKKLVVLKILSLSGKAVGRNRKPGGTNGREREGFIFPILVLYLFSALWFVGIGDVIPSADSDGAGDRKHLSWI
jgi:hypothetical protein